MENFGVSIRFDCVNSNGPLEAAKKVSQWLESGDGIIFDVINEKTNETVSIVLSEENENSVLPNNETKSIEAYQLHDAETEEILGSVFIDKSSENSSDELFDGWGDFNKLEEYEGDYTNVNEFVTWFNKNYVTQIGIINMNFIQHCKSETKD